jgi:hypothetical protein
MKINKDVQYENIEADTSMAPVIFMQFKNNELVFFSCGMEFPLDAKGKQPISGEFGIEINNPKYFPLKPIKITDPNSVYKWLYILEYKSYDNSYSGDVKNYIKDEREKATIKIYSTF